MDFMASKQKSCITRKNVRLTGAFTRVLAINEDRISCFTMRVIRVVFFKEAFQSVEIKESSLSNSVLSLRFFLTFCLL